MTSIKEHLGAQVTKGPIIDTFRENKEIYLIYWCHLLVLNYQIVHGTFHLYKVYFNFFKVKWKKLNDESTIFFFVI